MTTIDETGRLEIPLEIRQQLGLAALQSLSSENVRLGGLVPYHSINYVYGY